jgi:hypothetical protein
MAKNAKGRTRAAARRPPAGKAGRRKPAAAGRSAAAGKPGARRASPPRPPEPGQTPPAPDAGASARAARRPSPASPSASPGRGKYVYCIIRSKEPLRFGPIGIGAEPGEVHTVNHRELAALVSDTPTEVFDATRDNVLAHERVNETVMRKHTVIPMSFGTVFKTRDDIVELLRAAYDAFMDVLTKMDDKLEFGLKVLWDRDVMVQQIEAEDEDVRRLKDEISSQKGSTYFARMQYGRAMDAALEARSERLVSEIFELLRPVSVASRANKPIGDKMILNAAFLVARAKESEFDAKVKKIGARHEKLTFKYTGPWPPYNFVNIRLKLERAKESE